MADGQLSVALSADIEKFIKGLQDASKASIEAGKSYSTAIAEITQGTAKANATSLNPLKQTLTVVESNLKSVAKTSTETSNTVSKSLAKAAQESAKSGQAIGAGSNQAAFALTNLGRVAQDAPFGFIGIQNNLNPLLESFQRLRAEAGSNSAALKSLGQSLIGPAGIGIALSVVSAAVLFYQQYQQRANKETQAAEKALKNAKKSAEEYAEGLDVISRARLVGAVNAQREIVELRTLYAITQDTTLSLKQRTDAVNELQKKYPEYFSNIKDENILNGSAASAYDRLTNSIIATSRARAAQDIITKNSARQLENEQKILDLQAGIQKDRLNTERQLNRLGNQRAAGSAGTGATSGQFAANLRVKQAERERDANAEIQKIKADTNVLDANNLRLTTEITKQVKSGADLAGKVGDIPKSEKEVKSLSTVLRELNIDLIQADNAFGKSFDEKASGKIDAYQKAIDDLIKLGYNPATDAVKNLVREQQRLFQLGQNNTLNGSVNQGLPAQRNSMGQVGLGGINVQDKSLEAFKRQEAELLKSRAKIARLIESVNQILSSGISGGLSSFASGIGQALANGASVIDAVGKGLLSGIGDILTQLGEAAIKIGVGLTAIKAALKSLNPFVAIAAGVGLIALGSFFSARSSKIGDNIQGGGNKSNVTAFANGGVVYGPTNALIGEYAGAKSDPEVVAPLSKLKSIIGKGTSDNPVTVNTVNVGGEFDLQGKKLVALIKRVENSRT